MSSEAALESEPVRGVYPSPPPCARYKIGKHRLFGSGCLLESATEALAGLEHIGEGIWRRAHVGFIDSHQYGTSLYLATGSSADVIRKGLLLRRERFLSTLPCASYLSRQRALQEMNEQGGYDETRIIECLLSQLRREAATIEADIAGLQGRTCASPVT